ncbi:conserved hypothetical protein [Ricinus communis]|uniref:Reverse transcriptase zinc-binding domain-containing protein n=1 Tax=Ricinus communis TaxID=3988 RepID=B9R771_RICCO|nr:conserved hypothetical protein [Ricinus communis]
MTRDVEARRLSFNEWYSGIAKRGNRPPWIWSTLLHGREVLAPNLRWNVCNGRWVPGSHDFKVESPHLENDDVILVSDLIDTEEVEWKDLLRRLFNSSDQERIRRIVIGPREVNDDLIWDGCPSGAYSMKKGYAWLMESNGKGQIQGMVPRMENKEYWRSIWKLEVPPKIQCFLWRWSTGAVTVSDILFKRHCSPSNLCIICGNEPETICRMLFHSLGGRRSLEWLKKAIGRMFFSWQLMCAGPCGRP